MKPTDTPLINFERTIKTEAERVLSDVIFLRSPIQSRLLKYLVERSCDSRPAPSQYEVAVDGLGRDPDYDLASDSYPRVQISRLRRNLDDYYARNLPHSGLRIAINASSYKLDLVPVKGGHKAEQEPIIKETPGSRLLKKRWPLAAFGLAAAAILGLFFFLRPDSDTQIAGSTKMPVVALSVNPGADAAPSGTMTPASQLAKQVAEIQLTNSLVSNYGGLGFDDRPADYNLTIRSALDSRENDVAFLSLTDPEMSNLYSNSIPYRQENRGEFIAELEATLVHLTAPNGVIAKEELAQASDPLASDFLCFVSVESHRGEGEGTAALVDKCLARHPDSKFSAYWYARRAQNAFRSDVVAQRPLAKDSGGWRDLQRAFDMDRTNAFANFLAARVELADDDCETAAPYVSTTVERGGSYPALIAAIETDVSRCAKQTENPVFDIGRIHQIARYNPSPEPLLHLNLIIAAIAQEDRVLARNLAKKIVIKNPETPVEKTGALIGRSVESASFAARRREELASNLRPFVWNEAMVDRMVSSLANG